MMLEMVSDKEMIDIKERLISELEGKDLPPWRKEQLDLLNSFLGLWLQWKKLKLQKDISERFKEEGEE